MVRLAGLLIGLAACGEDRYLLVESQPGPLADVDDSAWVITEGLFDQVSFRNERPPEHQGSLRISVESIAGGSQPTQLEVLALALSADMDLCPVRTVECSGVYCEVEYTIPDSLIGDCMFEIRARDADERPHEACWYHGQHDTLDFPDPQGAAIQAKAATDRTLADCRKNL